MTDYVDTRKKASTPEPAPTGNGDMVIFEVTDDLVARAKMGIREYGTPLRANNGRDALNDAYQESLDMCMYLKQAIMERDSSQPEPLVMEKDFLESIEKGVAHG